MNWDVTNSEMSKVKYHFQVSSNHLETWSRRFSLIFHPHEGAASGTRTGKKEKKLWLSWIWSSCSDWPIFLQTRKSIYYWFGWL